MNLSRLLCFNLRLQLGTTGWLISSWKQNKTPAYAFCQVMSTFNLDRKKKSK